MPAPSIQRPKASPALTVVEAAGEVPGRRSCARSLPYISAPSVATVTTTSLGPRSRYLAIFTAATMLQMLDRPNEAQRSQDLLGHVAALGQDRRGLPGTRRAPSRWSVARSVTAVTMSVLKTLWMSGTCLSPMPWMLCSPKPLYEQGRALERLDRDDRRP